jgi:hypothetical protein
MYDAVTLSDDPLETGFRYDSINVSDDTMETEYRNYIVNYPMTHLYQTPL